MSYGSGTRLAKWQWDVIFDPALIINPFEGDEEGMSDNVKNADQFLKWLKSNIGKKSVQYSKNLFYAGNSWFDVPQHISNPEITFYIELGNSGLINFDSAATNANIGVSFELNNKYHNGFYFRLFYANEPQKEAITIWFYSYENFSKFYQYLGLSLSSATKERIINSYKESIKNAQSDCNKLDVIYETIPDFVTTAVSSETLYAGIESLMRCDISHLPGKILLGELNDTDEEKALLNLINNIDKKWLYEKINNSPDLIENLIINKMGFRYEKDFLKAIIDVASARWEQSDYENSNYYTLGSIDINLGGVGNSKVRQTGCLNLGKLGEYKFGTQFQTSDDGFSFSNYGDCEDMFETQSLTAILVETENGESGMMPALVVKYLSKQMIGKSKTDFINLSTSLLMPELFISKANKLKVFGQTGSGGVGKLNLGKFLKKIGDYEVYEGGEVFYRGMSNADFELLKNTGKIPYTSETFTSPTLEYIKAVGYGNDGVIVKIQTKQGTLNKLIEIGMRNDSSDKMMEHFSKMPFVEKGWLENNALFKTEGAKYQLEQINIGLGKGKALDIFNENLLYFEIIK
jgi:hypothetical protein